MGKIFYIMGKSASGKDKIYSRLAGNKELNLKKLILYTTRPVRDGEENGKQYYFTDEKKLQEFKTEGKVIEARAYNTVYGVWTYFTADDGQIDLKKGHYLGIGTLESYQKMRNYYGESNVIPVYIEVEDGERLIRAIKREKEQETPKYEELCRRFLADQEDFSEEIEKCINDSESIALTGDLNLMARKYIENKICIYSHMANNNDESIATTIITSRYICKQYEDMLALVLEAIQKAIFIIYSSPEIATEVCYKISDEIDSYRMPDENIQKEKTEIIISIINSDHLYPMTTDISFSDWKKTVNYYLSHGINIFEYMREHNSPTRPNENEAYVAGIYQKMFFKNPAHTAERKIVEDFGVDCNTFDKEIPYHLIRKLKNKILFFMKKDFWYILCFILFVCVVGYVVYQTFYNNNHDYISNVGLIFGALSLIWGILTSLGVFPKLKKTSRYDD